MMMQNNITLLIVIGFLLILISVCLGIITYLAKRILDEKPIAIKETVAQGERPQVLTRADIKVEREYQKDENFRNNPVTNLVDLDQLSVEQGMAELEKFSQTWDSK